MSTTYAEAAYFDGNHCQHCADREDYLRRERIRKQRINAIARREWDAMDGRSIQRKVQDDLAALNADPAWRARVDAEWNAL